MIALVCNWGGDIAIGPSGDIAVAPVESELQQRIIRRLLTNAGDYIWHNNYGAGLGTYVGEPYSPTIIEYIVSVQLQQEPLIVTLPPPSVLVSQSSEGAFSTSSVKIQYQIAGLPTDSSTAMVLDI
jgi:hypothetical protein